MAFNFTDSWNPAGDSKQAPWGSYAKRFAGDKYGDLSKSFGSSSDVTTGQGSGTQSSGDLTLIYNKPSQVSSGGENPLNKILGTAASIGIGALAGGFGGGGSGGGSGGGFTGFNPSAASFDPSAFGSGPTFNPGVAFSGRSFI